MRGVTTSLHNAPIRLEHPRAGPEVLAQSSRPPVATRAIATHVLQSGLHAFHINGLD